MASFAVDDDEAGGGDRESGRKMGGGNWCDPFKFFPSNLSRTLQIVLIALNWKKIHEND